MTMRLVFDDLDELRDELRRLPADLTGEAGHIIEAATIGAAARIRAAYPVVTGHMRDGVQYEVTRGAFAVVGRVWNTDAGAQAYESGRQWPHPTKPGHVFIPIVIRERRRMYGELKDLLRRKGLEVEGDA